MDDYPSNSRERDPRLTKDHVPAIEPPAKKADKVIVGKAKVRKTPLGKKMAETFIKGNISSVAEHVWWELMIPSLKEALDDSGREFLSGMLFGNQGTGRRSDPRGVSRGYTNYSRYAEEPRRREREVSERGRRKHDFGEIVIESRMEAESILDHMGEYISNYGVVTVADLYDMADVSGASPVDKNWGWTSISTAGIDRLRSGEYVLDLPRTTYLKDT